MIAAGLVLAAVVVGALVGLVRAIGRGLYAVHGPSRALLPEEAITNISEGNVRTMEANEGGRHMAPAGRRRRRLKWAAGGVVTLLVVGAAVAYALLQLRAPFTGGGNIKAPPGIEIAQATVASESNVDCTTAVVSTSSPWSMTLQMDNGFPGGSCDVDITLRRTGTTSGLLYVSGVDFADAVTERFVGTGTCGQQFMTSLTTVTVRFTLGTTTGAFTALPTAGITAQDTLPVPASCSEVAA